MDAKLAEVQPSVFSLLSRRGLRDFDRGVFLESDVYDYIVSIWGMAEEAGPTASQSMSGGVSVCVLERVLSQRSIMFIGSQRTWTVRRRS